jgi:hypothetical protein
VGRCSVPTRKACCRGSELALIKFIKASANWGTPCLPENTCGDNGLKLRQRELDTERLQVIDELGALAARHDGFNWSLVLYVVGLDDSGVLAVAVDRPRRFRCDSEELFEHGVDGGFRVDNTVNFAVGHREHHGGDQVIKCGGE